MVLALPTRQGSGVSKNDAFVIASTEKHGKHTYVPSINREWSCITPHERRSTKFVCAYIGGYLHSMAGYTFRCSNVSCHDQWSIKWQLALDMMQRTQQAYHLLGY